MGPPPGGKLTVVVLEHWLVGAVRCRTSGVRVLWRVAWRGFARTRACMCGGGQRGRRFEGK